MDGRGMVRSTRLLDHAVQVLDGERFGDDALVAWAILAFGCWVAVYNVASVAVARLQ